MNMTNDGLIVRSHERTDEDEDNGTGFPTCTCDSDDGLCLSYRREYTRLSPSVSLRVLSCGICGGVDYVKFVQQMSKTGGKPSERTLTETRPNPVTRPVLERTTFSTAKDSTESHGRGQVARICTVKTFQLPPPPSQNRAHFLQRPQTGEIRKSRIAPEPQISIPYTPVGGQGRSPMPRTPTMAADA
jgi:hypothetical protein